MYTQRQSETEKDGVVREGGGENGENEIWCRDDCKSQRQFSSSMTRPAKRIHEKIRNCGGILPLMFPEPMFIPSSMWSPGDARDSSMICLQVAPKLEGRQRDEQKTHSVRNAWVLKANSKSSDGCCPATVPLLSGALQAWHLVHTTQ